MKIKAITYAGKADVYNLEVEDTHSLAVGSGVIVHNCADEVRYLCMSHPIKPRQTVARKQIAYDPLSDNTTTTNKYDFYKL